MPAHTHAWQLHSSDQTLKLEMADFICPCGAWKRVRLAWTSDKT